MDMYQKRKMRAENKKNKEDNAEKSFANASFSWYIPTNVKPLTNIYK